MSLGMKISNPIITEESELNKTAPADRSFIFFM